MKNCSLYLLNRSVAFTLLPLTILFNSSISAQENGTATFQLSASTDSENTQGRHYRVTRYLNESCEKPSKGSKLYRKKFAKNKHTFATKELSAGELFIFQVDYEEKRRDSERKCSVSMGFTPKAGHSYQANYEVSGQVSSCSVSLTDVSDSAIDVEAEVLPKVMCTKRGANGYGNGVPSHSVTSRF